EANLSEVTVDGFPAPAGRELWCENRVDAVQADTRFGPWMVRWSLKDLGGGSLGEDAGSSVGADVDAGHASALARLSERMGIEPEYRDAHGKVVRTSDETRRKLLAAMGVPVANETE